MSRADGSEWCRSVAHRGVGEPIAIDGLAAAYGGHGNNYSLSDSGEREELLPGPGVLTQQAM